MKHLKLILKTLISNNACVEAARTKELKYNFFAIGFALLSVLLAILPISITAFNKTGTDWLNSSSYNYELDRGIYYFSKEAKDNNISFTLSYDTTKNKSTLTGTGINNNDKYKYHDQVDPSTHHKFDDGGRLRCYAYKNTTAGNDFYSFEVYDFTELDDSKFVNYVSSLISNLNPYLKVDDNKKDEESYLDYTTKDGKNTKYNREASFIAFGKNCFYAYLYNPKSRSAIGSTYGDYNHMKDWNGKDIVAAFLKTDSEKPTENIEGTYNNWKNFFNIAYLDTRWNNGWKTTGIMLGVDFGVLIFMGLIVFILTRGKNNPFRIYSFWDGQKIAYYAAFTPGILALIGFALPSMAMMFYVLCIGIRVMWLSMRTLRYTAPSK